MRTIILIVAILLIAPIAVAVEHADLYIIPVAAHAPGSHGTQWRSDIVLHNFQSTAITVEMSLIEMGRQPTHPPMPLATMQIAPGETKTVTDVLAHHGTDLIGAIVAGAEAPFVVTSRTYAEMPSGRTLGQTVLPIAISGDAGDDVAVLAGLADNASQRSNIGLFAASSRTPFTVEIALVSASGAPLGSHRVTLQNAGFIHHQLPAASGAASAIVRVVEGEGLVVPYASIVDNHSAEAMFLPAAALTNAASAARTLTRSLVDR